MELNNEPSVWRRGKKEMAKVTLTEQKRMDEVVWVEKEKVENKEAAIAENIRDFAALERFSTIAKINGK
ncbi:hypothetical protein ACH3XW_12420 [Acanthocheilonema viteae]